MFNIDLVNSFSTATVSILKSYCGVKVEKGDVVVKRSVSPLQGVGVFIGITGDISGRILFDMERETASKLVSLLNEEVIESINDIFIATMKEFTNMSAGVAINHLSTVGIDLDMTTPTIIMGEHMSLVEAASERILNVNYISDIGTIGLNIILHEEDKVQP